MARRHPQALGSRPRRPAARTRPPRPVQQMWPPVAAGRLRIAAGTAFPAPQFALRPPRIAATSSARESPRGRKRVVNTAGLGACTIDGIALRTHRHGCLAEPRVDRFGLWMGTKLGNHPAVIASCGTTVCSTPLACSWRLRGWQSAGRTLHSASKERRPSGTRPPCRTSGPVNASYAHLTRELFGQCGLYVPDTRGRRAHCTCVNVL